MRVRLKLFSAGKFVLKLCDSRERGQCFAGRGQWVVRVNAFLRAHRAQLAERLLERNKLRTRKKIAGKSVYDEHFSVGPDVIDSTKQRTTTTGTAWGTFPTTSITKRILLFWRVRKSAKRDY